MTVETYLSLGSNLGDRSKNIYQALDYLDQAFGQKYTTLSSLIETEPWGFSSENKFLNCAVRYDIGLKPTEILKICKAVEAKMGREVKAPEFDASGRRIYHSRIIDIDIILYGPHQINLPDLIIPHPKMYERQFVLSPLSEILSDTLKLDFPKIL